MQALLSLAAVLAVLATPAAAEGRYDRKLEQAILDIVAKKMGGIRGGFSFDAKPESIVLRDFITTGSVGIVQTARVAPPALPDGLMRAVERKVSRIVAF